VVKADGASKVDIQFGANENQTTHTFRHVINQGFDADAVQSAISSNLSKVAESLPKGQYTGSVVVKGTTFEYSAFKLPNGTINVGRITPPR
jgi:filamentous hemagglutinin